MTIQITYKNKQYIVKSNKDNIFDTKCGRRFLLKKNGEVADITDISLEEAKINEIVQNLKGENIKLIDMRNLNKILEEIDNKFPNIENEKFDEITCIIMDKLEEK